MRLEELNNLFRNELNKDSFRIGNLTVYDHTQILNEQQSKVVCQNG